MKENKHTGFSKETIREILTNIYCWDIEQMAKNYGLTIHELKNALQNGYTPENGNGTPKTLATYDVLFTPMVNVEAHVADPENPTEEEMDAILVKAYQALCDNAEEKLSAENVSMIRLYRVKGDKEWTQRDHYIFGSPEFNIDPEILVELTQLTYETLYHLWNNGVEVSRTIRKHAAELTAKYVNTDWHNGKDFWLTMETEADKIISLYKTEEDKDDNPF